MVASVRKVNDGPKAGFFIVVATVKWGVDLVALLIILQGKRINTDCETNVRCPHQDHQGEGLSKISELPHKRRHNRMAL